jgi:hypothetical protein
MPAIQVQGTAVGRGFAQPRTAYGARPDWLKWRSIPAAGGGQAAHSRRGPADRRQHRQAAGAAEALVTRILLICNSSACSSHGLNLKSTWFGLLWIGASQQERNSHGPTGVC